MPGKIVVTGVGTSGIAARKVAHMLACVERPAIYLNATDAAHGDLGFCAPTTWLLCCRAVAIRMNLPGCCLADGEKCADPERDGKRQFGHR